MACYTGQEAVANELVNRGANVNQPNQRGCTPLHLAAVSTNGALCLELLVNNGADVNMQVSSSRLGKKGLVAPQMAPYSLYSAQMCIYSTLQ
jgi:ankyrin repeat protein